VTRIENRLTEQFGVKPVFVQFGETAVDITPFILFFYMDLNREVLSPEIFDHFIENTFICLCDMVPEVSLSDKKQRQLVEQAILVRLLLMTSPLGIPRA
jgi:hypothetical protein